jgi:phage gpG-like protein
MRATVLMLALLGASPLLAQSTPPEAAHAARHLDNLATLLDLTDAQKAQLQTILQEEHAKMKASLEQAHAAGSKPDWQQMKALHEQIHQETMQKLTPVLSAEQLKKFQIIGAEMHGHFHHPGMDGQHGAPDGAAAPPAQN